MHTCVDSASGLVKSLAAGIKVCMRLHGRGEEEKGGQGSVSVVVKSLAAGIKVCLRLQGRGEEEMGGQGSVRVVALSLILLPFSLLLSCSLALSLLCSLALTSQASLSLSFYTSVVHLSKKKIPSPSFLIPSSLFPPPLLPSASPSLSLYTPRGGVPSHQ